MSKPNTKLNFSDLPANRTTEVKEGNFNDSTTTSLKTRYRVLFENLQDVTRELSSHRKEFSEFQGSKSNFREIIEERGDQLKDNVEITIQRMDGDVQKSLSHQKAENSRLEQQINQLNADKTVIGNKLIQLEKRINELENQIGKHY